MNNNIVPSLKLVYKPLIMYYGEWELLKGLSNIAIEKRNKNLYEEFIDKYYYKPLIVIFKDEEIARSFKFAICSKLGKNGRSLYFSKKVFLSNIISNIDEVALQGEGIYKDIKKYIRDKKDFYRDVDNYGDKSVHYEEMLQEYASYDVDMTFEEFVSYCRKKYTRLLTGYNAVLDLFDKSLNVEKFIECFNPDKLYLHTAFSILEHSKKYKDAYGRLDYNISVLDTYRVFVNEMRTEDKFYNSYITYNNIVYTIDDLFKAYDALLKEVNGK